MVCSTRLGYAAWAGNGPILLNLSKGGRRAAWNNGPMTSIGTPLSPGATRALLLGSGELGKEVAIELMRLGVEVIACDRYADAPAMQVAHRSHVLDMLDADALRAVIAAGAAAPGDSRDRGDRHRRACGGRGGRHACGSHGACDAAHDGPRGDPPPRSRGVGPAHVALSLCGLARGARGGGGGVGHAVRRQARHVVVGQGPVGDRDRCGRRAAWAYAMEGARAAGHTRDRRGLRRLRLRDHPADRAARGRHRVPRPDRAPQEDGDYRESWQPQPMSDAALAEARRIAAR